MKPEEQTNSARQVRVSLLFASWIITLLISILPDVLFRELTGHIPGWLFWSKIGLLTLLLSVGLFWKAAGSLRQYFMVFLVLYLSQWAFGWIGDTPQWKEWFRSSALSTTMLGNQLLKLGPALILVTAMWIMQCASVMLVFRAKTEYIEDSLADCEDIVKKAKPANRLLRFSCRRTLRSVRLWLLTSSFT